ncbi:aminopeptidase N [Rhodoplanes sp. Z2-YC6860]|uniref:aminopeptidase N n=1 Tax=Rhodoplanes sp. Z2-YC6860 TaxID=674703 RepID=UPI0012ECFC65|nr:aminopeptidase N [Rhodoplanes sp. Z2-YC6860]
MRTEEHRPVRLSEYRPPDWLVETVDLDFKLHPTQTPVRATLKVKPNPAAGAPAPLVLDGDELSLISVKIDGQLLPTDRFTATPERLTIAQPPNRPFTLEIETLVDPKGNTQLSGLYQSSGNYCTQCEAEGFRRITYYPDRPDVMAVYTTRIEADKAEAPVLLSNGNLKESGDLPGGKHFAVWHDPWPKPAYLFALVGGRLGHIEDKFVTKSGRNVTLRIYVEPGKENRAGYAMDSLKRSMRWDEEAFGREYDLDIFMVVAVSDFNMGAMENKGLNVFNDKYVLATSTTATDSDYVSIEAIIAHEYFHNWTGNRITCRDWFQLCLKEGFTVYRDQEFTSDQRSRVVTRIGDVRALRTHQFVEDAGPLAHPVRPELYREINNFYTTTVYEKGAEVVRMIHTMLGPALFRQGTDLYFERHDGEAATVEQFVICFADASGRDFGQFMRWYSQAGTPEIVATGTYDAGAKTYRLDLAQVTPPTPSQPTKEPMVIPLVTGLIGRDGRDLPLKLDNGTTIDRGLLVLDKPAQSFVFTGINERPALSTNRNFSAPIKLTANLAPDDLRLMAAHDSDPFNRWQAVQTLATQLLVGNVARIRAGQDPEVDEGLLDALAIIMADKKLEPAFVAETLLPPSEADIAREIGRDVDPDAIFRSRAALRALMGLHLNKALSSAYETLANRGPYSPDAVSAGHRTLRNVCLDLLAATQESHAIGLAARQYQQADNMTDRMAALATLSLHDVPERAAALDDFYQRYKDDPLIIDKWFVLQAATPDPKTLDRVKALTSHPAFSMKNPNRVRSLIGAFAQGNQTQFNRPDGQGYEFIADTILTLDPANPQLASRMSTAFKSWRALEAGRRGRAQAALKRIADKSGLSRDVSDIVQRALADT